MQPFSMLFPNYSHTRFPPPVRPSRSLEGLERVIPPTPTSPYTPTSAMTMGYSSNTLSKSHYSPTRSDLFLNKPLPAKPLPDAPPEYSAMWSDSSDEDSDSDTIDSTVGSPSEPRNSTESYPIFVSSASDDYGDLVDHPAPTDRSPDHPPDHVSLGPVRSSSPQIIVEESRSRTDSAMSMGVVESTVESDEESEPESASNSTTSASDAQYGRLSQWSQNRTGTNHYFREKKWDFFPELAPSAVQSGGGRTSSGLRGSKSRKKDGRLNVSKRRRWNSLDRAGLGLAHDVRDSIKTYVHRTLSRDSTDAKVREAPRPSTAPVNALEAHVAYNRPEAIKVPPHSEVNDQLRALSISTASTASEMPPSPASSRSPRTFQPRQKQLAVPMSNYQKYGPAIWESPKKSKKKASHPARYPTTPSGPSSPTTGQFSIANPTPPLSPPLKMQLQNGSREAVRAIQGGRNQVLYALDGAKKKMAESKDERRREQLKAQIKLIGPVNPHTYMQSDPWV